MVGNGCVVISSRVETFRGKEVARGEEIILYQGRGTITVDYYAVSMGQLRVRGPPQAHIGPGI